MSLFSDRLRELRLEAGVNQSDVANILGVSNQSYSAYETGREPKYQHLAALCRYFNVSSDYLIGLSEARNPEYSRIVETLGLTEKAILTLENLDALFEIQPEANGEIRTLLDTLNDLLEIPAFYRDLLFAFRALARLQNLKPVIFEDPGVPKSAAITWQKVYMIMQEQAVREILAELKERYQKKYMS